MLEAYDGRVVGIEVKARSDLSKKDFLGLEYLSELVCDDFVKGIILYTGEHTIQFGEKLFAVPISDLWK